MSKVCSKCQLDLPTEMFSRSKSRRDGLNGWCKNCYRGYCQANADRLRERNRCRRSENLDRYKERQRVWREANKDELRIKKRNWYESNKPRILEHHKRQREENIETVRERDRNRRRDPAERSKANQRWRNKNIDKSRNYVRVRRAKIAQNSVLLITDKDLRRLHSGPCASCGALSGSFDVDHIIPLSRGGRHSVGNLQRLCSFCNRSKGTQLMIEFRSRLKRAVCV